MKKLIFCFSFVCAGMLTSCVDKNELVDEDSLPEWLGSSIYEELKKPKAGNGLTGTFNTYLRLVDDLKYTETLSRTGSNTVFPANDEAFERFFASETWPGVRRYEDLSDAQKKMLLYSSMLDNALLIGMLSNSSSNDGVLQGRSLKHRTSAMVIDTVTTYPFMSALAAYGENNQNWTRFTNGISVVTDATRPMLVHFTREYMLNNGITTAGDNNDFSLLTGGNYQEGDAYIFGERVVAQDITCQNGYIHQVENVVTPPGNMAQVIKKDKNLTIFSHMLDRFAVPVYNAKVTSDYHDWYKAQSEIRDMGTTANPDSIFEVRYLSRISQGNEPFVKDVNDAEVLAENLLTMDPGWNEFYVAPASAAAPETNLADLAAMFVPTDEALVEFFTKGDGKTILDTYGTVSNEPGTFDDARARVYKNVETVPMNIIAKFISNVLKTSFAASVPSKFNSVVDDAKDQMGLELAALQKKENGDGYDVKVANNGVIYVTNKVFPPKAYVAVSAPALFRKDLNVTNWIIQNVTYGNTRYPLNLDYYAYLLTMASNYAMFLPTDKAFDTYYLDPASLGRDEKQVYHYYYTPEKKSGISVSVFKYDEKTGLASDSIELDINNAYSSSDFAIVRSHLSDLIQYCTVVLNDGEKLGKNRYYKTKHGGAIRIDGNNGSDMNGAYVSSGRQIGENLVGVDIPAQIEGVDDQRNGMSYRINRLIQGPTKSVYKVLQDTPQFKEFFELCNGFDPQILEWVGISSQKDKVGIRPIDQYKIFHVPGEYESQRRCVDNNVKMFSNYNYTVYAPNNEAMEFAYAHGLPRWEDVNDLYNQYVVNAGGESIDGEEEAKAQALEMIEAIKRFTRYHFHNTSLYIDNVVDVKKGGDNFITFLSDKYSINKVLTITSDESNAITIHDATDMAKTIKVADGGLVNEMTRDFEFDDDRRSATRVTASSFAVVHELNEPLFYNAAKTKDEVDYRADVDVASAKYHK